MGLLDQLVAGLGRQSADSQQGSVFLDLATTVIQGHPGGLAGLLEQFTAAGLGREASSWVSTGQNLPISAEQLAEVLGQGNVRALGKKFNISPESASFGLASLLPALVDHLTPNGQVETPLTPSLNAPPGRFNV